MSHPEQLAMLREQTDAASFDQALLCEQLNLLYRDSTTYYRLGMGCALVCCTLLWQPENTISLGAWLLIYGFLTWGGVCLNSRFQKSQTADREHPVTRQCLSKWRHLFTLGGILVGSCWGALLVLLTPPDNVLLQSAVVLAMTGLALYASAIFSALLVSYLGFILPAFLPFILLEYMSPDPIISPVIVPVFLAFLIYSAWRNHLLLTSSLSKNVFHRLLLKQVKKEQQITLELNQQLEHEAQIRSEAEQQLQQAQASLEQQIEERTQELSETNKRLKDAVAEQRQTSLKLERNRQRYAKAIEASDLGLWEWDLATDEIYHSHFEQLFGFSEKEVPHFMGHLKPLVHEDDYPALRNAMVDTLKGVTPQFRVQFRVRHKSGQWRWLEDTGRVIDRNPLSGRALKMIGTRRDISDQIIKDEKLSYLANYDDLTNVANRSLFKDRLHIAISQARLNNSNMALILLDIDRFKAINNTLGHEVGDLLLKEIADRLTHHIQGVDTIARLGADEFAVILDQYHHQSQVSELAEKISKLIHTPIMIDNHELIVSCSMGISLFPKHTRGLNILINQADVARNKVKQQGGSGFEFYSDDLQTGSLERLKMESDLRKALQRNELCVYYQPKLSLSDNKICEAEALVRWNHPETGLISPASFIPIAEETGLISALGEQVLIQSCHQVKVWLDRGVEIKVSVNLSAQQLANDDLVGFIDSTIQDAGIPHRLIELELTESSLIDDPEHTISVLEQLRSLGITLAIDDFGTGYSSLSYLQRFPLDVLKIDRSFLKQINSPDPQEATLTKAIIALGRGLEMKIVAEGVETRAQLEFLCRQDCDFAQGFYISPPVPAQTFYELVENHNSSKAEYTL